MAPYLPKTLLITRPGHDLATNYLMHWSQRIIELAESKQFTVLDLKEKKANKLEFIGRMTKVKPEIVMLNGHGNSSVVTGHDNEPLVETNNANILKDSITYARACDSATDLGQKCVDGGARAYIGFNQPFILCYDEEKTHKPTDDEIASRMLEPSNQLMISLLKGHTVADSCERSNNVSRKQMSALMSSDAPDGAATYLKYIWYNMKNQIYIGDGEASI